MASLNHIPQLAIQPQQEDPLSQYGKLLSVQNLSAQGQQQRALMPGQLQAQQQALESGLLDNQAKQRQAKMVDAMNMAMQGSMTADPNTGQPTFDRGKVVSALAKSGQGSMIPQITETFDKLDQQKATLLKTRSEGAAAEKDYEGSLGAEIQAAGFGPGAVGLALSHMAEINPARAAQLQQQFAQNPDSVKQWAAQAQAGSPKQQQLAIEKTKGGMEPGTPQAITAQSEASIKAQEAARGPVETETSLAVKAAAGDPAAELALKRLDASKRAGRTVIGTMTSSDVKDVADAIENGDQPPTVQGLYRNAGPVKAELARRGVPLAQMETDWKATQKYVGTLNGTQQVRLRQAISTASDSLDKIDSLYQEYHRVVGDAGMKAFNKVGLVAAKNLPGRAGAVATALDAQIADVTSELGNVYMGGNSPTDHSLTLAAKNLSSDWNRQTFEEALKQAHLNLGIRKNSIMHAQPAGTSGGNTYFGGNQDNSGQNNQTTPPPTGGFDWSKMPQHK